VYLKTVGVDPNTHEVSAELERIKRYYGKIQAVENPARKCFLSSQSPPFTRVESLPEPYRPGIVCSGSWSVGLTAERTRSVDKAAAHRFITASIPLAQRAQPSSSGSAPSTSAQAQAAADARTALGLETGKAQDGSEVELGASGDTSKAGRFRFIPRQAQKTRARAEDAWNDVNELKDDDDEDGEGNEEQPVASGSKTRFDDDGEAMESEAEDAEEVCRGVEEKLEDGQTAEDDGMAEDDDVDEDEDDTISQSAPATKAKSDVEGKKKRAKQSEDVAQAAKASKAGKKDKKKKKKQKKQKVKGGEGSA
jgi:hypothetical protein